MNDPFLYGLLIFSLLVLLTLKSAFGSVNQLQLELDKKKLIYHSRILSFISKKTLEFSVAINICYFFILTILTLLAKTDLSGIFLSIPDLGFTILFVFFAGLIFIPLFIFFPVTLGEYFSNEIINFLSVFLILIYILLFPVTKAILLLSRTPIQLIFHNKTEDHQKIDFSKDDLSKLVIESQKHSSSDEEIEADVKLFKNALDFSDIKLRECMIPRTEIIAVEISEIDTDLKSKFISSGHSKILVYKENIENIIGYIKSKSLFNHKSEIRNSIRTIHFFPESMPANKLLAHFIRTGQNIAIVVDEFGGTSGIVTIEDILEEIFGEIQDEHDTDNLYEKQLSKFDYVLSGRLEIDYLNEKYNIDIPESDEYETIAGFILFHTENLPTVNDSITIDRFKFKILKVSETKLELVKLEINQSEI